MRDFNKIGFITFGNPNHYDGTGAMRKELRARIRDEDAKQLLDCFDPKDIKNMHQDEIGDYLSDAAPDGFVFEIRPDDRGNHNYGYFPIERK